MNDPQSDRPNEGNDPNSAKEQEWQNDHPISRKIGGERYIFLKEGDEFTNDFWIDFLPKKEDGK